MAKCFTLCSPSLSAGEVEPPTIFSESGGVTGIHFLEGVAGKEGGDLFQGDCNFWIKSKLKSGLFNDKKVYKQECFALL